METKIYEVDDEQIEQMEFIRHYAEMEIDHPIFHLISDSIGDREKWKDLMKDGNLMLLVREVNFFEQLDHDDSVYKRAMINMLKIRAIMYATNWYFRSRIGYDMWYFISMNDPESYYQLIWENHFEPSRWHKPGQRFKEDEIEQNVDKHGKFQLLGEYNIEWKPDKEIT